MVPFLPPFPKPQKKLFWILHSLSGRLHQLGQLHLAVNLSDKIAILARNRRDGVLGTVVPSSASLVMFGLLSAVAVGGVVILQRQFPCLPHFVHEVTEKNVLFTVEVGLHPVSGL